MSSLKQKSIPLATAVPVAPFLPNQQGLPYMEEAVNEPHSLNVQHEEESSTSLEPHPIPLGDKQIHRLMKQGFTRGLARTLDEMRHVFAQRFWIVDNSGSMQMKDGHRLVPTKTREKVKMVSCSRWDEIVECVDYHIRLAGLIRAPTHFRFLNDPGARVGPQHFSVAASGDTSPESILKEVNEATSVIHKARPGGPTPLTRHVLEIHEEISRLAPAYRSAGKKVVIVIVTDGLPTDFCGRDDQQEFIEALRLLEGLPVWVVVRLCTDEDDVVQFYNDLDSQLELSVEVLDDFTGEAEEVKSANPWLNYGLPLHRLREMGYHDRVFDMLDERLLTTSEFRDFCSLLFGADQFDGVADPDVDWRKFKNNLERMLRKEAPQFDPIKQRVRPWMSLNKVNKKYSNGGCVIM